MFFDMMAISFHGIMEVLVIGIAGFLVMSGIKGGEEAMNFLTRLVIRVTLPCLVFTTFVTRFEPGKIEYWWAFPLLAVVINILGVTVARGYVALDRSIKYPGDFMALVGFQNGVFLPLAFAPVLFGPDKLPHFLNLVFLYNLLSIPTFFTLAVWLVNLEDSLASRLKTVLNPPNLGTILGLVCAMTGIGAYIPEWVIRPLSAVGSMSSTLACFFVGGIIVTNLRKTGRENIAVPVKSTVLKSFIFPTFASLLVYIVRPPEYIALFIIMQSVMPSALMIALITPNVPERQHTIAGGILLSSLVSILTIPLFMGIYGALYG